MTPSQLDRLKQVFDEKRSEWIADGHLGEWALIGGDEQLVGFFKTYEAVVSGAQETFGQDVCLLQQVLDEDRTEIINNVYWEAYP